MSVDLKRFQADVELLEKSIKKNVMLFYGSSTFAKWNVKDIKKYFPSETVVNNGFGGSVAEEALYYSDKLVFPFKPKILCYYEGDNDPYCGYTFTDAFCFTKTLLDKITDIPVYVLSVKYSSARFEKIGFYEKYNDLSRKYCRKKANAAYVDFNKNLLGKNGIQDKYFMNDRLHLNADGYAVLASALKEEMAKGIL